jgi:hypothetical protein
MAQVKDTEQMVREKISLRTRLGVRKETATSNGYILVWSNAYERWNRYYYMTKKGTVCTLDANYILVYNTKAEIDSWSLPHLPCGYNSFERVWGKV